MPIYIINGVEHDLDGEEEVEFCARVLGFCPAEFRMIQDIGDGKSTGDFIAVSEEEIRQADIEDELDEPPPWKEIRPLTPEERPRLTLVDPIL